MFKILSKQSNSITGAAIILGAASLVSRLIGIVRDRIFAHYFGAGDILDAYYAAFKIPDFVYNLLIIGALSAGFIPIFTALIEKHKKEEAWRVTNTLITSLSFALVIICGILFIFTPQMMKILVPGFSGEKMAMAVQLTRIMLISPFFHGLSTIVGGVIQSYKHFLVYALAPIVYNISIIIGALFFVPVFGVKGLAIGVVLGALLHLTVQLPSLYKHGFRFQWLMDWKNTHVRSIGKLMLPRTLGLAVQQINWLVLIMFASTLGAGSVAIFTFADNLQYAPVGIIGVSFAMAAFPILAGFVARGETEELVNHLVTTIRQILFFIIPITIIFILLRAQLVRVLLGSGAFDWKATILTMNTVALFSISLFAQSLSPLLARTLYTLRDTWSPFFIGIVSAVVNILASIILKEKLGVEGLALAFSLAAIVQTALLWLVLRTKIGSLKEASIVRSLVILSMAGLGMGITIQLLKTPISWLVDMTRFWGILLQGMISGMVGLLVYIAITRVLGLEEVRIVVQSFKRKWLRIREVPGEAEYKNEI